MTPGKKIKELRLAIGMSQEEVAAKIGVTKQAVYKYENEIVTNIPLEKIEQLAALFDVSPSDIMGWNEKQNKLPDNADELIDEILKNKSNMAIVMGKGGDRRVIEVPEDAEAYIQSFIDAINKKRDK